MAEAAHAGSAQGDVNYDPLFPLGFGLTYNDRGDLRTLTVDTTGVDPARVFFTAGPADGWELVVDKAIRQQEEAGGRRMLAWPGGGRHEVTLRGKQPISLALETNAGKQLAIDVMVEQKVTSPVMLSLGCGELCGGEVDVTSTLSALPAGVWRTIRVPLRSFAEAGADMNRIDVPFRLSTSGPLTLRFADVEVVPGPVYNLAR